jgi:hypothetical protein
VPWQSLQERFLCSPCSPELGGMAWQLPQGSVAVTDHDAVPWHELAQLRLVAFQPIVAVSSWAPLLCVAAFTAVAL